MTLVRKCVPCEKMCPQGLQVGNKTQTSLSSSMFHYYSIQTVTTNCTDQDAKGGLGLNHTE